MGKLTAILLLFVLTACATGPCRETENTQASQKAPASMTGGSMTKSSSADRVKVFKPDGSLQCGQGKSVPVAEMQKQLKGITVHSAINKNDGMMRIQLCGSPTGNSNVYEIDRKDLDAAIKLGFKEWLND